MFAYACSYHQAADLLLVMIRCGFEGNCGPAYRIQPFNSAGMLACRILFCDLLWQVTSDVLKSEKRQDRLTTVMPEEPC